MTRSLICSSARFRADITTKERLHPTTWRSPLLEAVRRCCLRCASRSERTAWASSSARRSFACTHHTTRHRIPASVRSSLSRRVLLSLRDTFTNLLLSRVWSRCSCFSRMYAISSSVYAWRRVDRVHRADGREADEAASAAAVVGGGDLDLSRPRRRARG